MWPLKLCFSVTWRFLVNTIPHHAWVPGVKTYSIATPKEIWNTAWFVVKLKWGSDCIATETFGAISSTGLNKFCSSDLNGATSTYISKGFEQYIYLTWTISWLLGKSRILCLNLKRCQLQLWMSKESRKKPIMCNLNEYLFYQGIPTPYGLFIHYLFL